MPACVYVRVCVSVCLCVCVCVCVCASVVCVIVHMQVRACASVNSVYMYVRACVRACACSLCLCIHVQDAVIVGEWMAMGSRQARGLRGHDRLLRKACVHCAQCYTPQRTRAYAQVCHA